MAQLLSQFEREIEPHITKEQSEKFKAEVRRKVNALAVDALDVMRLEPDMQINGAGQDVRDRIFADGAAQRGRTTP